MRALPERLAASKRPAGQFRGERSFAAAAAAAAATTSSGFPVWRRILLVAGIALTASLATFSIRPLVEDWLVSQWEARLTALELRQDPAPLMAEAAERGDWGLRLLVVACSNPNERANLAAIRQLQLQLDRWTEEPNFDHSQQVETIVQHLAQQADRYSPDQLLCLLPLIERLSMWPVASEKIALAQYLQNTELLVRRLAELPPQKREFVEVVPDRGPEPPQNVSPPAEVARLDPPSASLAVPPPEITPLPLPAEAVPQPETSPTPIAAKPPMILEMLSPAPSNLRRLDEPPAPSNEPRRLDPPEATPQPNAARRWEDWSDWQVIRLLQRTTDAGAAEEELRLRGYQSHDLRIARLAVDPEPAVRLKLTEELPRIPGIDARLWLLQMAEDSDREVKQAAAAILRTASGGPLNSDKPIRR